MTTTERAKDLQEFAGSVAAEIRLAGKILCVLENPPVLGDEFDLMVRLKVTESCATEKESGEHDFYRKTKLVGAWRPGSTPPIDTNQASLWDQAPPEGSFDASADEGDEIIAARNEERRASE